MTQILSQIDFAIVDNGRNIVDNSRSYFYRLAWTSEEGIGQWHGLRKKPIANAWTLEELEVSQITDQKRVT